MKKKGVSALVTTVLILGFTIALAAVIMTWGSGFSKRMQEKIEEQSETRLLCSRMSLELKKTCWDDNKIFLMAENTGSLPTTHLRIMAFSEESSGEAVTENEIEIAGQKTYTVNYDKEKLGEISHIRVLPYVKYKGQPYACNIIDKEVNDCVTPEQPEPVLPEVVPDETPEITYGGDDGDGGDGGDGGVECGNDVCEEGEDCSNCEADCGCDSGFLCQEGICVEDPCGDGSCEANEDCSSCAVDCGCDEGYVCQEGSCGVTESICINAEDYEICDGLDMSYGEGYQAECCSTYTKCC